MEAIWKPGISVRFVSPNDGYEAGLTMTVIEDRGNRVLVETPLEIQTAITPQAVYLKSELELAE